MLRRATTARSLPSLLWAVPAVTFGLGTWQLYRLDWKLKLVDKATKGLQSSPVPLTLDKNEPKNQENYFRRYTCRGRFLHEHEFIVGPRPQSDRADAPSAMMGGAPASAVYYIVTAFELENGERILVKRGWVPMSQREASSRAQGQLEAPLNIEGILREGEKASFMIQPNAPESNRWTWLDVNEMSRRSGAQPVLLELVSDSPTQVTNLGLPRARQPVIHLRNDHAAYAVTWYGMSIISALILLRKKKRFASHRLA